MEGCALGRIKTKDTGNTGLTLEAGEGGGGGIPRFHLLCPRIFRI